MRYQSQHRGKAIESLLSIDISAEEASQRIVCFRQAGMKHQSLAIERRGRRARIPALQNIVYQAKRGEFRCLAATALAIESKNVQDDGELVECRGKMQRYQVCFFMIFCMLWRRSSKCPQHGVGMSFRNHLRKGGNGIKCGRHGRFPSEQVDSCARGHVPCEPAMALGVTVVSRSEKGM